MTVDTGGTPVTAIGRDISSPVKIKITVSWEKKFKIVNFPKSCKYID